MPQPAAYGFSSPGVVAEPVEPKRSAIPKVIGILMIIFGSLAIFMGIISLLRSVDAGAFARSVPLKNFVKLDRISTVVGMIIGALELYAGGRAVSYRSNAPTLAMVYAWLNIATTVVFLVLVYAWLMPEMSKHGMGALVGVGVMFAGVISIAWPIVVLALMSRPSAKASCSVGF